MSQNSMGTIHQHRANSEGDGMPMLPRGSLYSEGGARMKKGQSNTAEIVRTATVRHTYAPAHVGCLNCARPNCDRCPAFSALIDEIEGVNSLEAMRA